MSSKRFCVAYGDNATDLSIGPAPEWEKGDFLTRLEAAEIIVARLDTLIEAARINRRKAVRVIHRERTKP